MAVDMFIKIGDLKGEAKDKTHKDEIDVLAWSWGMSNSGSAHTGGGAGAGKVNVQDVSFTKYIDKSSPDLMLACCNGNPPPPPPCVAPKPGPTPRESPTCTLTEVMAPAVSTGGSGGGDRLTENITLNFAKVKVDYKEQTATGTAGATPSMTWDI